MEPSGPRSETEKKVCIRARSRRHQSVSQRRRASSELQQFGLRRSVKILASRCHLETGSGQRKEAYLLETKLRPGQLGSLVRFDRNPARRLEAHFGELAPEFAIQLALLR